MNDVEKLIKSMEALQRTVEIHDESLRILADAVNQLSIMIVQNK